MHAIAAGPRVQEFVAGLNSWAANLAHAGSPGAQASQTAPARRAGRAYARGCMPAAHAETATQRLRAKKRATGPPLFGAPASQRCLSLFPTRHCIRHSGLVCSLRSMRECDSCNEDSSNFKFNQTYIDFFNIYSFVTDGSEFTSSLPLVSKKNHELPVRFFRYVSHTTHH